MFYDQFAELCTEKGITANKVLVDCGISRTSVAKWKKGATPNGTTIQKLSDYFGVTTDYLLGMSNEKKPAPSSLSPTEGALIHLYRSLPAERQELLMEQARFYQCLEQKQGRVKKKE